jgi:translation initiation factor 2 beta subunit (eIF-2beta)/eIF-5
MGRSRNSTLAFFTLRKQSNMISAQIERLRRDSRELVQYSKKLEKKGRADLVHKIMLKKQFIDQHIEDVIAEQNSS